ncbi:MAG: hypothetical protein Q7S27_03850 [Nanoarchaeota archaeon]|nr:hypothetical protein [Nanoarchaeota archaeon]
MINVKNIVLGIGIVIIYGLVLWQGIEAFYPMPQYDDFCPAGRFEPAYFPSKPLPAGESCSFSRELQEAERACYAERGNPIYEYDENGCQIALKSCDYCNRDLEKAIDEHSKIVFIIAIIIGVITLIVGYGVLSTEPVGSALIGSGIWAIFWGSAINWRNFSSVWRFSLLLVALVLVVWFALRLNKPGKKGVLQKLGMKK